MRLALLAATAASALLVAGCQAIAPLLGAGVGAAINREERDELRAEMKRQGEVARTFTQPLQRTKTAVVTALKRMAIDITESAANEKGVRVAGNTKEHAVGIELMAVTEKATRMNVKVGAGDTATAKEIIEQTERALNRTTKG